MTHQGSKPKPKSNILYQTSANPEVAIHFSQSAFDVILMLIKTLHLIHRGLPLHAPRWRLALANMNNGLALHTYNALFPVLKILLILYEESD